MFQKRNDIKLELIMSLLLERKHSRALARILKYPVSTLSRKLNELVKENVLDCKEEGKNKVYFLKRTPQARSYIFMAEFYKVLKLIKNYPEMEVIITEILKNTNAKLVMIFGSYAKFRAKKDSDIDIYIETTNRNVKKRIEEIHSKIRVKIGRFSINSPLIREIIKDHIIIRGVEYFYEKAKLL